MTNQSRFGRIAGEILPWLVTSCICVGMLSLAGCRRKRDQGSSSGSQAPATVPGTPATSTTPPSPVAAGNSTSASQPPPQIVSIPANHFSTLSQALLTFRRDKQRAPKDWQELIAAGYLKALPPAPLGKRYTFHPQSLDVLMVSQ